MTSLARQKSTLQSLAQKGRLLHGISPSVVCPALLTSCYDPPGASTLQLSTHHPLLGSTRATQWQPCQTLVSATTVRWLSHRSTCLARLPPPRAFGDVASCTYRTFSTSNTDWLRKTSQLADDRKGDDDKEEKVSIFKRFKQMYRDYWYVLVPVHLVTSSVWFGAFYYASKSGLDIAGMLQAWGFSETITDKLRNSSAGHLAVAYALYKLATPARYTVTLGGTTYSIKFLSERGYIKPVPSRKVLKDMYDDRKEEFKEKVEDTLVEIRRKRRKWREQFQERRKRGWRKR